MESHIEKCGDLISSKSLPIFTYWHSFGILFLDN
jgi:hypothetical protein